jgi:F0F1-type ATP synthase assembly protein I
VSTPEPPPPSQPGAESAPAPLPSAVVFLGLGTAVAACVGLGVLLGVWLDGRVHSSPLFLVLGLLLGVCAAVATVVTQVRRFL